MIQFMLKPLNVLIFTQYDSHEVLAILTFSAFRWSQNRGFYAISLDFFFFGTRAELIQYHSVCLLIIRLEMYETIKLLECSAKVTNECINLIWSNLNFFQKKYWHQTATIYYGVKAVALVCRVVVCCGFSEETIKFCPYQTVLPGLT